MYPLVRDFGATGAPVAGTCRILDFSRQAFYYWCANQVSARDWDEAHLIRVPTTFIRTTLSSGTGSLTTNSKPLATRRQSVVCGDCAPSKRCSLTRSNEPAKEPFAFLRLVLDVVLAAWSGHHTPMVRVVATMARTQAGEGKLYMCPVKDVFSNKIIAAV